MGWEIAAVWRDEPDRSWSWIWRRVADDSGQVLEESRSFTEFEACIEDAEAHGLDLTDCVVHDS